MLYLSQLLGTPVESLQNVRVGKIADVLIPPSQVGRHEAAYPDVLLIEGDKEQLLRVPIVSVELRAGNLHLLLPLEQLAEQAEDVLVSEVFLARDVLDKQVIDIARKKAVRVNDVCLGEDWRLLGIDASVLGLIRRLAPSWLIRIPGNQSSTALIPWEQIEPVSAQRSEEDEEQETLPTGTGQLRALSRHLTDMHPADIATIVHQLTPGQGARLIEGLDDKTAADTMEEIDTERQRQILENINLERAAAILQAMGPDEIADLLAQLPEERTQELLRLMKPEESEDVQELLEYEQDTAGGLMTTDYIALNQIHTVAEALEAVRASIRESDVRIAYIYCVADETQDETRLLGVVSLWDLLAAEPAQLLQDLMETDVITVGPDDEAHAVAEIIAKYNLLAVPVVNAEQILEGVVTVDDALDVLLPPERRRRPNRMY
ncbi:magnesium transporter [Ktedonosporobacter rubrisoli]|uniref:Magnesium transporter n=1 Tax=Ktedonosporobacter rubrisoli TaxID=2509675 RepID=A0A4P6JV50_KTERU|nr:CBS domain-containing protein [Ktedonosporobacter rubrisoli]QBD79384.1 magnesium transporter [Ktedonosporobacter rubrisoli]